MAAELRAWHISGRVQGVFFRASTRRMAERLGLVGYAINRPDGTVEVAARGDSGSVERLAEWLGQGPTGARVDKVVAFQPDPQRVPASGFVTG
ncbi:MAG: acylphosphatase [Wenzhouxiangella sp.]|jgi:acylphosphatase|nr:acylphosphatase [Wenzhouxiangella sp.]